MKFKVGQKVVAKGDSRFNKGEIVEIIEVDNDEIPYYCKNNAGFRHWQYENDLYPLEDPVECYKEYYSGDKESLMSDLKEEQKMTFEEKLDKFKSGEYVLNTPTQEIFDKLMEKLEEQGYMWGSGIRPTKRREAPIADYGSELCIRNDLHGITYADRDYYVNTCNYKILKLSLSDFQSSPPTTIVITSDNHHKVTAESNGVTAEALCNPEDKFSITKGAHMALQRLLDKTKETAKEGGRFHVGDIVEILNTESDFLKDSVGLQEVVTEVGSWWAKVTFCNSNLKLIRRAQKDTN